MRASQDKAAARPTMRLGGEPRVVIFPGSKQHQLIAARHAPTHTTSLFAGLWRKANLPLVSVHAHLFQMSQIHW